MKDINSTPGATSFSTFWNALCGHARQAMDGLAAMPWPMLLACAIGLAFVITILPLVITLFAIFLLLKWASNSGGLGWGKKAAATEPPQ